MPWWAQILSIVVGAGVWKQILDLIGERKRIADKLAEQALLATQKKAEEERVRIVSEHQEQRQTTERQLDDLRGRMTELERELKEEREGRNKCRIELIEVTVERNSLRASKLELEARVARLEGQVQGLEKRLAHGDHLFKDPIDKNVQTP